MKKKILLLIILLIPFIVSSEQLITELDIYNNIDPNNYSTTFYDNDSRIVVTVTNKMYIIEKNTGKIYSKEFSNEQGVTWINYDYENETFPAIPASHYLVYDYIEQTIYLLDSKLNEINKSTFFNGRIEDYYTKDGKIYIVGNNDKKVLASVYDKDLNLIKTSYLDTTEYFSELKYDAKSDLLRVYNSDQIYRINDNYEIENAKEYDNVTIANQAYHMLLKYGEFYYTLEYTENKGYMLRQYNENLELIKQKSIIDETGIKDIAVDVIKTQYKNGKLYLVYYLLIGGMIEYEIDEDLTLRQIKESEISNSNITNEVWAFELDSLKFKKSLTKIRDITSEGDYVSEISNMGQYKQIGNKLYAEIPYIQETEDGIEVDVYFYTFNDQDKKENKIKITSFHLNNEKVNNLYDSFSGLTYLNNKIIYYQKIIFRDNNLKITEKTNYYELDKNGNLIGEIDEPKYFKDAYTITSNTISGGYELLYQITSELEPAYSRRTNNSNIALNSSKIRSGLNQYNNKLTLRLIKNNKIDINSPKGKVELSNTSSGEEVELNITPQDGYKVKNIKVTTTTGEVIEVKDNKFIMPNDDVTVDIEYEEITNPIMEIVENPYTLDAIIITISIAIISFIAFIYNKKKTAYLK